MSGAANVLNNTILVPYHDSLTDTSHDLKQTSIAKDIEKYAATGNDKNRGLRNQSFTIKLISNGKTTVAAECFNVEGLSMTREVERESSGGEALYEIKAPGKIGYGEVRFHNLYTDSPVFLDWLINGASQGGALLADVEITVGDKNGSVVYTLRDAFPVSWELGNLDVVNVDMVTNVVQRNITDSSIPLEGITLVYGRLDYTKAQ